MVDKGSEGQAKGKIHYAWWVLVACCALMLGGQGIIGNCAGVFFAPVATELGVGRGTLSMYMTIASLATCITLPLAGRMLPRWNIRIALPIAMTLMCVNAGLMSVYTQVWQWYVAGVIQGLLGAFVFLAPAPIILNNWFYKRAGFAVGLAMAFSGLGGVVFNPIISGVIESSGWRVAYVAYALMAAVVSLPFLIFLMRYKPEDMGLKPYGWEPDPALDGAAGRAAAGKGSKGADAEGTGAKGAGVKGAGAKGAAATYDFREGITLEQARKSPVYYLSLLLIGLMAFASAYYQHFSGFATSIGWTTVAAGALVSAVSLGNMVLKLVYGTLCDKIGVRNAMLLAVAVGAVGFAGFIFLNGSVAAMFIAAVFYGSLLAVNSVGAPLVTRAIFGQKDYARIYSRMSVAMYFVGAFGVSGVAYIYDAFGSYLPAFAAGIVVCVAIVVLLVMCLAMGKHMREQA